MRQLVVALVAACGSNASSPPASPIPAPTAPVAIKQPPPNTRGTCHDDAHVDKVDAGHQPKEVAGCPDVLELFRGNGIGKTTGAPPIAPGPTPDWDLVAMRDYACAYACAHAGATASLLAWSAYEDDRPLRNHTAAFLVEDGKQWTVVVMFRHAFNEWWNISTGPHTRETPVVTLDHRPTTDELAAALARAGWSWSAPGGFKLIAGNVIDELWPSPPTERFAKP
jgi:hypothetical protein